MSIEQDIIGKMNDNENTSEKSSGVTPLRETGVDRFLDRHSRSIKRAMGTIALGVAIHGAVKPVEARGDNDPSQDKITIVNPETGERSELQETKEPFPMTQANLGPLPEGTTLRDFGDKNSKLAKWVGNHEVYKKMMTKVQVVCDYQTEKTGRKFHPNDFNFIAEDSQKNAMVAGACLHVNEKGQIDQYILVGETEADTEQGKKRVLIMQGYEVENPASIGVRPRPSKDNNSLVPTVIDFSQNPPDGLPIQVLPNPLAKLKEDGQKLPIQPTPGKLAGENDGVVDMSLKIESEAPPAGGFEYNIGDPVDFKQVSDSEWELTVNGRKVDIDAHITRFFMKDANPGAREGLKAYDMNGLIVLNVTKFNPIDPVSGKPAGEFTGLIALHPNVIFDKVKKQNVFAGFKIVRIGAPNDFAINISKNDVLRPIKPSQLGAELEKEGINPLAIIDAVCYTVKSPGEVDARAKTYSPDVAQTYKRMSNFYRGTATKYATERKSLIKNPGEIEDIGMCATLKVD